MRSAAKTYIHTRLNRWRVGDPDRATNDAAMMALIVPPMSADQLRKQVGHSMRICQAPAGQLAQGSAFTYEAEADPPPPGSGAPSAADPSSQTSPDCGRDQRRWFQRPMSGPTKSAEKITMPFTDAATSPRLMGKGEGRVTGVPS